MQPFLQRYLGPLLFITIILQLIDLVLTWL